MQCFRLKLIFLIALLWMVPLQAQDANRSVPPAYTQSLELLPQGDNLIRFNKDGSGIATIQIVLDARPISLLLSGPGGAAINLLASGTSGVSIYSVLPADGEPGYPGCLYKASLDAMASGAWVLAPTFSSIPSTGIHGVFQMVAPSSIAVLVEAGRARYPVGEKVVITLYAGAGTLPVTGAQIDATLRRVDVTNVPDVPLTFHDDGQGDDETAGDGNYLASLENLVPGQYSIWATVRGTCPDGPFQRTCNTSFRVYRSKVIIGSTIEDYPIVGPPQ